MPRMTMGRGSRSWFGAAFGYLVRRGWRANLRRAQALGLTGTLRRAREILQSALSLRAGALLDRRLGLDTSGQLSVLDLNLPPGAEALAFGFGSIPVTSLRKTLQRLGGPPSGRIFIDMGCGKGRALAIAAEMGFRHLIGVEHAAVLASVARANMDALARRFPDARLQIVEQDAAIYDPPPEACLIFFYTPFPTAVLRQVLARLEAGLQTRGVPITLLFARQRIDGGPQIETAVAEFPRFQPMALDWPRYVWSAFPQIDFAAYQGVAGPLGEHGPAPGCTRSDPCAAAPTHPLATP